MSNTPSPKRRIAIKAEATAWWVRLDSGDMDNQQHQAFQDWLNKHPSHRTAFADISRLWGELDTIKSLVTLPTSTPAKTVAYSIIDWFDSANIWRFAQWSTGLAVGCLLMWLSPLSLWVQADFTTGIGEINSFKLSDGSTVHLNSNSALEVNINGQSRQLTLLKGEALFEVSADKNRPFRVHADNGTVTALGTAFNIRLQQDGAEVTVTEHSVAVDLDQNSPPTKLEQGQRLTYDRQHGIGATHIADTSAITAWQRGRLVFQNKPLGEVIAELNRYHRGYMLISDDSIAQRRVNGVFHVNDPLAVVSALQTSLQIKSSHISDYLILLHR